ncbi:MAG: thiamine biosynthesis protein ThiJ [Firmicutes bacterium ML8_F2]|jgi:protein deglycase|nr:MAG: thiamine biosynthesis protein ThiJ [Firmicutes bacterium ML8_F2]
METIAAVHLAEGFEEIEAVTIIDVLRRAEIPVIVVSVTGKHKVTGSHDITVTADQLFEDIDYGKVGMIILPGGMPGSANLKEHAGLRNKILKFKNEGRLLGAICAAPMVFGSLGLLEHKKATCYPGFENYLTDAEVTGNDVEVSGKIITGKGPGVAIHFALKIAEIIKGKETSDNLAADLQLP